MGAGAAGALATGLGVSGSGVSGGTSVRSIADDDDVGAEGVSIGVEICGRAGTGAGVRAIGFGIWTGFATTFGCTTGGSGFFLMGVGAGLGATGSGVGAGFAVATVGVAAGVVAGADAVAGAAAGSVVGVVAAG